jgi:hypothetical protein
MSTTALAPFPGVYQVAYVTNDFERALKQFGRTHHIGDFLRMTPMHYGTRAGREAICNVALAYAGATEIEIIEPLDGDVQLYRDYLPTDGSFAVRFHHLSRLFNSERDLEQRIADYRRDGRAIPIEGSVPEMARYFYADFRAELGHYMEGIYFQPGARKWLDSIPRF